MAALDAGWSRTKPEAGQSGPENGCSSYQDAVWQKVRHTHVRLHGAAASFARELECNHQAWLRGWDHRDGGPDPEWTAPVDTGLFSVTTWLPFGHPDTLAMVAVDDIDAAHVVVGRYGDTVEEVTTAFCPRMDTYRATPSAKARVHYGIPAGESGCGRHVFADFLDLIGNGAAGEDWVSPAQRQRPLLILSRFRLFPLLTMGRALTATAAVCRLAAETVLAVWRDLKQRLRTGQGGAGEGASGLYGAADLEAVRVCFLDLQDEEEIGILVTGTNYTVMMAMIAAVQRLTLGRLADCEPAAAKVIFNCRSLRQVLQLQGTGQAVVGEVSEHLGDCHLFRWSRSVAAASPHLLVCEPTRADDAAVSGGLGLDTLVGIMPGHQADAESILHGIDAARYQTGVAGAPPWRMHLLGLSDLLLHWQADTDRGGAGCGEDGGAPGGGLIPTAEAVRLWPQLLEAIDQQGAIGTRRDFTAWETLVSIPVPVGDLYHGTVGKRHRRVLHDLLARLEGRSPLICLDEQRLRDVTRRTGFPATSTRPLILLSQSFRQVLSDPLIFDVVVDYMDLFETLATALVAYDSFVARTALDGDHPLDYTPRPPLALVDQLNELLGAIDDALELRLRRIYPEDAVRDWSLDLRSQNHQVFLAADAALKCAVAVFRKDVLGEGTRAEGYGDMDRATLGVVLRLGYDSGMNARDLRAFRIANRTSGDEAGGQEPPAGVSRLAIFNADFPHLRSVLVYADFYHESFHLIFDELAASSPGIGLALPQDLGHLMTHSWRDGHDGGGTDVATACREVFVHMMMLLFVFDGDRGLLLRDHFEGLSNSTAMADLPNDAATTPPGSGGDLPRMERAARFATQAFHAIAPVLWLEAVLGEAWGKGAGAVSLCPLQKPPDVPSFLTVSTFADRAWARVLELRDAFPDFGWIFDGPMGGGAGGEVCCSQAVSAFKRQVGMLHAGTVKHFEGMWFAARAIFAHHAARLVAESVGTHGAAEQSAHSAGPAHVLSDRYVTFDAAPDTILAEDDARRYQELQHEVDACIAEGWAGPDTGARFSALPRILRNAGEGSGHRLMPDGDAFDANLIVRRSLYHFLRLHRIRHGRAGGAKVTALARVGLGRIDRTEQEPGPGRIDWKVLESKPHAPFLIDRTAINHFCCVPALRRDRTGREIAVLKTMWGIASRNRARRLRWLVDKIQECETQPKTEGPQAELG